jgi:hypothetical protein
MTKYPPPYPRKDWSYDDPIPPRESQVVDYVYTQGKVAVDDPVFAVINGKAFGQKQLRQIRAYLNSKKRVRLGNKTDTDVTPSTKGETLLQQNKDRSPAQATLHPSSMVAAECVCDLFAIVLKEQQARRQSARLPMVRESFPNPKATLDQRWDSCKQNLAILNDMHRDQLDSRVAGVVRALRERSFSESIVREVMNVGEMLRHKRIKEGRAYQKYNPRPRKRLSELVDMANLPAVHEDVLSGMGAMLGMAGSAVASAYGLHLEPLAKVYHILRRKRRRDFARMLPRQHQTKVSPFPHQAQFDAFVQRNLARKARSTTRQALP